MIEEITKKIILSGDIVEVYEYEKGYLKGYKLSDTEKNARSTAISEESWEEVRLRSLKRAKARLRRLINSNVGRYGSEFTSKFLTLTFHKNIQDVKYANYEFTKFMKRLNYQLYGTKKSNIKYTTVIEFQKRGAIHYHTIIYNIPYLKASLISNIWEHGIIKINKIEEVDNVGAYLAEYLGQADKGQGHSEYDERLRGEKSYFSSRGLFKSEEITDKKIVEQVATALLSDETVYSAEFSNEHLGNISYKQYNLNSRKS